MTIFYDPACADYARAGHVERPGRVVGTVAHLRADGDARHPGWRWPLPAPSGDTAGADPGPEELEAALERVHRPAHLARLAAAREDFDADTPVYPDLPAVARRPVRGALRAAAAAARGEGPAFSLLRPPGHHATADRAMGFCYLNAVAAAALAAQAAGTARRVAVWDFDAHHGNGTEEILRGRPDTLFVSVHQLPGWPGSGAESSDNVRNYPVRPGTPAARHREILAESWGAVRAFGPDLILVSAGFDAYHGDPITDLRLRAEDFGALGGWLHREAPCPVAAVLEGGYSEELPGLVEAFLVGWEGGPGADRAP